MQYPETNGGWVKHAGGPVLGGPGMGTCFDVFALAEEDYKLYFSWRPKESLAVVTGGDGVHWSAPRVILGPRSETGWEDGLNRNAVVKRGGTYHMWYCGQARGYTRIGYATSKDGYAWERYSDEPVMIPEYPWEGRSVMCPHVNWDEEEQVFKMWYSAGETYEPDAIGYATSADGVHWRKHPANPIFTPDCDSPWEQDKVTACQVVKLGGQYVMFYIGFEDVNTARIGIARSPDGITRWQRHPLNPIVSPTPGGWDGEACYKPFAVWDETAGRWLLWYNGRSGRPEYVGLVTHDGFDLGFDAHADR
jgi:predicted GH43/DUF377 family glycosyl hydrolase